MGEHDPLRELLERGPSREGWAALRARVAQGGLAAGWRAWLAERLEGWPDALRTGEPRDLQAAASQSSGTAREWITLCRAFPRVVNSDVADALTDPLSRLGVPADWSIDHLALECDPDGSAQWPRVLGAAIFRRVRSLSVHGPRCGAALGPALTSAQLVGLRHLEVEVDGCAPRSDALGSSPIERPQLETLAFHDDPLPPSMHELLARASMPALRCARLTLRSAAPITALLQAPWFTSLRTLQLDLCDAPGGSGDGSARPDDDGLGSDGASAIDRVVRALASHPAAAGLRRLAIVPVRGSVVTAATLDALATSRHLGGLRELWLASPRGLDPAAA
ncbi:MAG: hypothetical protein KC636_40030, partial [Myxococcales bacterium]|nr:hypothetical protein [Myxococcales bacterium]